MKTTFLRWPALVAGILSFTIACSKNGNDGDPENNAPLVTAPEALATENGKSGGVYKGVLVGSTGHVKIVLQNGEQSVSVTMDGVTKKLDKVTFIPSDWRSGQAITNAVFEKDGWKVSFSIDAEGKAPVVKAEIAGHDNVTVTVSKESSTHLVKGFEGTIKYGNTASNSVFNFVVWGDSLRGVGRIPGDTITYSTFGTIAGGITLQGVINNASVTGTINGDEATGTIRTPNATATWSARRTL